MYSTVELVVLARAYLAWSGVAESTLSVHAFGNDKTLPRLLAGLDCTARTAERASRWFDSHWPAAAWPAEVVPSRGRQLPPRRKRTQSMAAES